MEILYVHTNSVACIVEAKLFDCGEVYNYGSFSEIFFDGCCSRQRGVPVIDRRGNLMNRQGEIYIEKGENSNGNICDVVKVFACFLIEGNEQLVDDILRGKIKNISYAFRVCEDDWFEIDSINPQRTIKRIRSIHQVQFVR